jgi:hypothetical protein
VLHGSKRRDFLRLSILFGALLLTKASSAAFAPLGLLAALWDWKKNGRTLRESTLNAIMFYVLGIGIGCWWYVRFYFMIGRFHPIPHLPEYDGILLHSPLDILIQPLGLPLLGRAVAGLARSLWGQVDWFLAPPQRDAMGLMADNFWSALWGPTLSDQPGMFLLTLWLYRLFLLLALTSIVGCIQLWLRHNEWSQQVKKPLAWMLLFFGLLYTALVHYTLFTHPGGYEGGRYLLPTIAAYATLFVAGWRMLLPERISKFFYLAVAGLLLLWDIGCAVNLVTVLNRIYAS